MVIALILGVTSSGIDSVALLIIVIGIIFISGVILYRYKLQPIICPNCSYSNSFNSKLCEKCGYHLSNKVSKTSIDYNASIDYSSQLVGLVLECPKCSKEHKSLSKPWICDGTIETDENKKPCRYNFKLNFFPSRNMELCTAIHAEERAIRSLGGRSAEGCTLYVNTFPCFQCARQIKNAGISKIVYVEAYPMKESVDFLKYNGVKIEPFEGFKPRVFNQVFRQVQ